MPGVPVQPRNSAHARRDATPGRSSRSCPRTRIKLRRRADRLPEVRLRDTAGLRGPRVAVVKPTQNGLCDHVADGLHTARLRRVPVQRLMRESMSIETSSRKRPSAASMICR